VTEHHAPPVGPTLAAVLAGAATAVQARANGSMGDRLDDGLWAAFLAFSVGLVLLVVIVASGRSTRSAWRRLRPELTAGRLRWWQLLGGLGGAIYVLGQTVTVATIGVALFTVCTVAGQTVGGAGVDRAGLAPGGSRPITWPRVSAAVLCTVAVAIAVSGRESGEAVPAYIALALIAGLVVAFQGAFNGQVAVATGSAVVSSLVNFAVAWGTGLVLVLGVRAVSGDPLATPPAPWDEPFLWLGGPIGVAFTIVLGATIRPLGVLVFGLASVAGALVGAIVVDAAAADAPPITGPLVLGVLLTFAAVALAGVPPRRRTRFPVRQDEIP
jgi:transporter family-2 protein